MVQVKDRQVVISLLILLACSSMVSACSGRGAVRDAGAFEDLAGNENVRMVPPGAILVSQRVVPPCSGDSGGGPLLRTDFTSTFPVDEMQRFYQTLLSPEGWRVAPDLPRDANDIVLLARRVAGRDASFTVVKMGSIQYYSLVLVSGTFDC